MVAAAWVVVATAVGVLVGRMVRERDRQVPPSPEPRAQADADDDPEHRVPGRRHRS